MQLDALSILISWEVFLLCINKERKEKLQLSELAQVNIETALASSICFKTLQHNKDIK